MFPILGAVAGAGALMSLFNKPKLNTGQSDADWQSADKSLNNMNAFGGDYNSQLNQAQGNYAQDNSNYRGSANAYRNVLGTDPYSDSYRASALGGIANDTAHNYASANASLTGSMNRRFPGSDLSNNSVMGGASAYMANGAANSMGGADINERNREEGLRTQRAGALTSLDQGMANNDYGRMVQNEQMGQNLNQQQYGDWANQANTQYNQGLQQQQYQNNTTSGFASGVGGIMGMMSVPQMGGYGGMNPQQPGPNTPVGINGQAGIERFTGYGGGSF